MLGDIRRWIVNRLLGITEAQYEAGEARPGHRRVTPLGVALGFSFCARDAKQLAKREGDLFDVPPDTNDVCGLPRAEGHRTSDLIRLHRALRAQEQLWTPRRGVVGVMAGGNAAREAKVSAAQAVVREAEGIYRRWVDAGVRGEGMALLGKLVAQIGSTSREAEEIA